MLKASRRKEVSLQWFGIVGNLLASMSLQGPIVLGSLGPIPWRMPHQRCLTSPSPLLGVEGIRFGTRSPISSAFPVIPNSTLFAASFSSYFYLSILLVPNITSLDVSPHAA
ncbi:hypothetical protein TNIN_141481 [Trichonephila inaurata madagascariensis]|uniref:Uncharacterized protein n=1 Tax=Trichonephila inaurata madagascariensis TaxID=2747483 RepID=A0A8X6M724_9ARAC|nr:hypothetical protein TNIN_141481 [Trichonephila inaurata madagascariensis]